MKLIILLVILLLLNKNILTGASTSHTGIYGMTVVSEHGQDFLPGTTYRYVGAYNCNSRNLTVTYRYGPTGQAGHWRTKDFDVYEPQSRLARLWLDSQHDNLPKGIRTIKMCKLYSNDALVTANGLASIVKENV